MSAISSFLRAPTVALFCGFVVTLATSSIAPAQDIGGFLDAGEFGLARQAAAQATNPGQRDQFLAQIAQSQADNGARGASLGTLGDIQSDVLRSNAIDKMSDRPVGQGLGGAALADFDTLIDLITTTIEPDSWDEVGGPGAIQPFPTGVLVDSSGLLRKQKIVTAAADGSLVNLHEAAAIAGHNRNVRVESPLRKVSLTALEKEIQLRWADGRSPGDAMKNLAGLHRIQYVLVYPESGDIVIAGPAGDWTLDAEGRTVHAASGAPALQLDDLVVLLRNAKENQGRFGCSINPREANLGKTQAFLREWANKSVNPAQRSKWLEDLRATVGRQDIEVFGIDPGTRVARVIVEADYRMKLVGMGLEKGTAGVTSYLAALDADKPPASMSVLRWWFTLNYDTIQATPDRRAYQLHGKGAQVLSENELLTQQGQRVHTGESDALTQQFAQSFTNKFNDLCVKYPVYADLRNIFDLAMIAGVIQSEGIADQVDWHMTHFGHPGKFAVTLGPAPTEVESVINHRLLRGRFVAGVSGGVSVDTTPYVKSSAIKKDSYGLLRGTYRQAAPKRGNRWWWD